MATVLITHDLGVVAGFCEKVLVMYGGRVMESAPTDPLFAQPKILSTPHVAAMTVEAQIAMAVFAATEIRRVLVDNLAPTNNIFD